MAVSFENHQKSHGTGNSIRRKVFFWHYAKAMCWIVKSIWPAYACNLISLCQKKKKRPFLNNVSFYVTISIAESWKMVRSSDINPHHSWLWAAGLHHGLPSFPRSKPFPFLYTAFLIHLYHYLVFVFENFVQCLIFKLHISFLVRNYSLILKISGKKHGFIPWAILW